MDETIHLVVAHYKSGKILPPFLTYIHLVILHLFLQIVLHVMLICIHKFTT